MRRGQQLYTASKCMAECHAVLLRRNFIHCNALRRHGTQHTFNSIRFPGTGQHIYPLPPGKALWKQLSPLINHGYTLPLRSAPDIVPKQCSFSPSGRAQNQYTPTALHTCSNSLYISCHPDTQRTDFTYPRENTIFVDRSSADSKTVPTWCCNIPLIYRLCCPRRITACHLDAIYQITFRYLSRQISYLCAQHKLRLCIPPKS